MLKGNPETEGVYYHRPPVLVDLFYLISAHAKFRSEAERILGWLMLSLNHSHSSYLSTQTIYSSEWDGGGFPRSSLQS